MLRLCARIHCVSPPFCADLLSRPMVSLMEIISYLSGIVNFFVLIEPFCLVYGIIILTWGTIRLRPNLLHHITRETWPIGAFFVCAYVL